MPDEHEGLRTTIDEWQDAWERAQQRADDLQVENRALRRAGDELARWASYARSHYGIEECAGTGQPETEWDEIQGGLAQAARDWRDVNERLIRAKLGETFTPEGVKVALRGRVAALGGERPIDLMETAEGCERVYTWACALAEGAFL